MLGSVAVHEDRVLVDGPAQLDEGFELLRRGAVVPEPVLGESQELPNARRVGHRVAQLPKRPEGPTIPFMVEVVGGLEQAGEVVAPLTATEPEDLALDVGRDSTPDATTGPSGGARSGGALGPSLGLSLTRDAIASSAP
jgi:hypothetical protein